MQLMRAPIACFVLLASSSIALAEPTIEAPPVHLTGETAEVKVLRVEGPWTLRVDGREVIFGAGNETVNVRVESGLHTLELHAPREAPEPAAMTEMRGISGFWALLPPLMAILLALALRQVILALFAGVWAGALVVAGFDPLQSLLRSFDHYIVSAVADEDHASILVFSLLLGGMIGLITRSGGGLGLASWVTKRATTSKSGQLATWGLGITIFFDDYANSLLVGSSMRPITDKLRVSREKLAFLVDATAAPVASVALVSSWIGVEVGYIAEQFAEQGIEADPYVAFLKTLPYRFYPWLMLFFGLLLVLTKRDFGRMYTAELRARETGKVLADGATPASEFSDSARAITSGTPRPFNAIVPVVVVVLVAIVGMYLDGRSTVLEAGDELTLRNIFGSASSLKALLWASAIGGISAFACALGSRALDLSGSIDAWMSGLKAMLTACVILVLAWSLGAICKDLHTADFVISALGDWLPPGLLAAAVFVVAAAVSFATGTSWGAMAILFPLVVPLAHDLAPGDMNVMLGAVSSILAGSVWGDHCSPISDTTIMSSMASSCDHVDHVRTQLPYALLVGVVSLICGEVATGFGIYPAWAGLIVGAVVLVIVVRVFGKPVPETSLLPAGASPTSGAEQEE